MSKSCEKPKQTMLYLGAFDDMWPIIRYSMWVQHFINVDGLPNSNYFRPECHGYQFCKDEETMVKTIKNSVPGGYLSWAKKRDNVL